MPIEILETEQRTNRMHLHIWLVTGTKHGNITTTCIQDMGRCIIMEKDKILARWYEHTRDFYNDDRGDMLKMITIIESPITLREVEHPLRRMPMKKVYAR